jgi:cysteine desulfurase/selenocysteine lyase
LAKTNGVKLVYVDNDSLPTIEKIVSKITSNTKFITFANASNLLGYEIDAQKLSQTVKTKHPNIIICVDSTQFIPHNKFDIAKANIDFCVCSGYKMLASTGTGVLYINDK